MMMALETDSVEKDELGIQYLSLWGASRHDVGHTDRMLLCGMIIQAAKDVTISSRARHAESIRASALRWLSDPDEGALSLSHCFSILFPDLEEKMTAKEFGEAILKNVEMVSRMDIPAVSELQDSTNDMKGFSGLLSTYLR